MNNIKYRWLYIVLSGITVLLFLSACDSNKNAETNQPHTHTFSEWTASTPPSCVIPGMQTRACVSCGFSEYSQIPALGHTEVVDAAVAATCTEDGKSEGKHCSVCNVVLQAQTAVKSLGHQYNNGEVIAEATCIKNGVKKFTCNVETCGYSYTEEFSLPTYTAEEIYNQSVKYVGEIVTYDKHGEEYSLGTGFVISSDGKIVTNYHVVENAYSAYITINNVRYNVSLILAYDENIDLAVLKIDASGLTAATICKQPVKVGSTVYAIGSSRGMTNTYSRGIVTYADRIVDGVSYIQHDASITHGNSGGPLINAYGEVIGINAWEISDSQNLNFAVFTTDHDHLVYGTALTFEEFYEKESGAFQKLKNYLINAGEYSADDNCYVLTLDVSFSSDYSSTYMRLAYYYASEDSIALAYLFECDGNGYCVYLKIDKNTSGVYDWGYFDDDDYMMNGTIYASDYYCGMLLEYSYDNIPYQYLKEPVQELASNMMELLCLYIDIDFAEIGVTAEDLHFYLY